MSSKFISTEWTGNSLWSNEKESNFLDLKILHYNKFHKEIFKLKK